ncbi:MAG: DUF5665 domain-containing protein [Limnochordia bacterium]|jgi:hypothetical protein|nr:DUF5665 domain-containing protein [Bacillota bacterium]HOB08126.1 DUF5665 domain-containing protein [Limnochordia bacterium]NLH30442.1 hypothetical protein [Bacillota bacterium]HPT93503.1 DUF5665 domain-containing protein [Limnochordia bacterium]HPZ30179.1 DUF5665 domain-containing protein [Limnochordia bacterium]
MNEIKQGLIETLIRNLEKLASAMEKASVAEYIELYRKPRRLLYLNFISGIARGFGLAVGFTAVGALFLYLMGRLAALNLPIVGEFIAEITRIVQEELSRRAY